MKFYYQLYYILSPKERRRGFVVILLLIVEALDSERSVISTIIATHGPGVCSHDAYEG